MKEVLVIGAGAAGMMAAIRAAQQGCKVTVLEKGRGPGTKLNITGKGRCNVTNDCDVDTLIRNVPRNGRFLFSAFHGFTSQDAMAFFEELGVPLKTERGQRVFPVSDRARDVSGALRDRMHRLGVGVISARAKEILVEEGRASGVLTAKGERLTAQSVIVATGGLSYPTTGSDGDGFRMAQSLGHTVEKPRPSLIWLRTREKDPARLEGLSLRNVQVSIRKGKKKIYEDFGEMVFTSNGVSGPVILSASAHICRKLPEEEFDLFIDLKPALDRETLDKRVLRDFEKNINRDFINALGELLPHKLIPVVVERSGIDGRKKVHEITKGERERLCEAIKAFRLTVVDAGPMEEAIVTSGGVKVKEIDPRTMESKLVPGLYFAGEVMDVDAYTGGFNLQIAWSTGHAAGMAQGEER